MKITKDKINIRAKLAELLNFNQMIDRLDAIGVKLGKQSDNTNTLQVAGDLQSDNIKLAQADGLLANAPTNTHGLKAVFVYDTTKDSDGGAWRHKTQHTTWYNEAPSETRGSRREFPSVAVIAIHGRYETNSNDTVTIYDADDPNLPMWMVFTGGNAGSSSTWFGAGYNGIEASCISAKNGEISFGTQGVVSSVSGLSTVNLICERFRKYQRGHDGELRTGVINRNNNLIISTMATGRGIDTEDQIAMPGTLEVLAVDMTVFADSPIDQETGLKQPTIAIGTRNGVSIIHPEWNITDLPFHINSDNESHIVKFDCNNRLIHGSRVGGGSGSVYLCVYDTLPKDRPDDGGSEPPSTIHEPDLFVVPGQSIASEIYDNQKRTMIRNGAFYDVTGTKDGAIVSACYESSSYLYPGGIRILHPGENREQSLNACIDYDHNTGYLMDDSRLATIVDDTTGVIGVDTSELFHPGSWTVQPGRESGATFNGDLLTVDGVALYVEPTNGVDLQAGKQYEIKFDITNWIVGECRVLLRKRDGSAALASPYQNFYDIGTKKIKFICDKTDNYFVELSFPQTNVNITVDLSSISIKESDNLIENGTDFTQNTNSGATNSVVGWTANNLDSLSVYTGDHSSRQINDRWLRIEDPSENGDWSAAVQKIPLVSGKFYTLTFDVKHATQGIAIGIGDFINTSVAPQTILLNSDSARVGGYKLSFTTPSTSTGEHYLYMGVRSTGVAMFDNIELREAVVRDYGIYSHKRNENSYRWTGLNVHGLLKKSPVNTGAEMTSIHGFDDNNALTCPVFDDMVIGDKDWCIMAWVKASYNPVDHTQHYIFNMGNMRDSTSDDPRIEARLLGNSGRLRVYQRDNSNKTCYRDSTWDLGKDGSWTHMCVGRKDDQLFIYLNGEPSNDTQTGNAIGDLTDYTGGSKLYVGCEKTGTNSYSWPGHISMFKMYVDQTPTDQMMKKIYQSELRLFQRDSKCMMVGDASGVDGRCYNVQYDESTDQIVAGAYSTVNFFQDLERVDSRPGDVRFRGLGVSNTLLIHG